MRHIDSLQRLLRALALAALAALGATGARAAGTTPLALAVQVDNQGNFVPGCLLYFYVAGTVATPQQVYQDFGLSQSAPNPLKCTTGSRVPQHWLVDGLTHIRLTDASGVVIIDTTMQVLGPSGGGGGGGGGTTDPTGVASTGDVKMRLSGETLLGWVVLNGQTVGSASSGATQRANADTQNLFVYLWQNCIDTHCPVLGGRGASAIADFNANKQISLPDMRSQSFVGRDCMGATCAGILLASNITSGGTDNADTAGAGGGKANQAITLSTLPSLTLPVSVSASGNTNNGAAYPATVTSGVWAASSAQVINYGGGSAQTFPVPAQTVGVSVPSVGVTVSGSGTATLAGGGKALPMMGPFQLGTWYIKL